MAEYRRSYCGLCHPRCGLLLEVESGHIVSVQGDPEHPVTKGVICERGRLMADHVHHPDRLNHPLKRKGEKRTLCCQLSYVARNEHGGP
ncbi:MAG: hypothetical protein ACLFT8_08165 [Desulfovermiculus sp.]